MPFTPTDLPEPVMPHDQKVRHFRQVADDGRTGDVFAQRDGQLGFGFGKHGRGQDFAQHHVLAFVVGQLDAHRVFARNGFDDTHGLQRHRACQIFRQGNNLAAFDTLRGFDFVARDDGTGCRGYDLYADAEFCQFGFD